MPNITIYSTPTCVYCKMAKQFLNQHNVPFTEKNVQGDMEARAEMVKKSGQLGVPVIDIDGSILVGFDRDKLVELAGIHEGSPQ